MRFLATLLATILLTVSALADGSNAPTSVPSPYPTDAAFSYPSISSAPPANFPPQVAGTNPYVYADFTQGPNAPYYYYDGSDYASFSVWASAVGLTYTGPSSKYVTNSSGVLTYVSSIGITNMPWDYVWNGSKYVSSGLLLEPSSTNEITGSNNFNSNGPYWTNYLGVDTSNVTGPDGVANSGWSVSTSNADSDIYYSTTGNQVPTPLPITSGTNTISIYAKAGASNYLALAFDSANNYVIWFDLSTGSVASYTGLSVVNAYMVPMANGWYRCVLTFTGNSSTQYAALWPANTDGSFSSVGGSVDIFGYQVESGSFPTSYIQTAASTVTRAADVLSTSSLSYYTNAETMYVSYYGANGNGGTGEVFGLDGGSYSDRLRMDAADSGTANSGILITSGGNIEANFTLAGAGTNYNSYNKLAFSASTAGATAVVNGGGPASVSPLTAMPTALNTTWIGSARDGSSYQFSGDVAQIGTWPVVANASQLQILTSNSGSSGFPPEIAGVVPTIYADFSQGPSASAYYYNNTTYPSFSTWATAANVTYSGPSTKYVTNGSGFLTQISPSISNPPWDYVTAGNTGNGIWYSGGLLMEPSATNDVLYSNDLSSSPWVTSNGTVTQNVYGPDNVLNSGWTVTGYIFQLLTFGTTSDTISLYAKAGSDGYIVVSTQSGYDIYFNIANGSVGTSTGITITDAYVTPLAGGWYRCVFTVPYQSGDVGVVFGASSTDGGAVDNGSVYVYGVQLETTDYATSYIPTTSAAVTRAADTMYAQPSIGFGSSYTIFASGYAADPTTSTDAQDIAAINDGTGGNTFALRRLAGNYVGWVTSGSTNQYNSSLSGWAQATQAYVAMSGSSGSQGFAADGTNATDGTGSMPVSPVDIFFGAGGTNFETFNGDVSTVGSWPVQATDAQLATLTTIPTPARNTELVINFGVDWANQDFRYADLLKNGTGAGYDSYNYTTPVAFDQNGAWLPALQGDYPNIGWRQPAQGERPGDYYATWAGQAQMQFGAFDTNTTITPVSCTGTLSGDNYCDNTPCNTTEMTGYIVPDGNYGLLTVESAPSGGSSCDLSVGSPISAASAIGGGTYNNSTGVVTLITSQNLGIGVNASINVTDIGSNPSTESNPGAVQQLNITNAITLSGTSGTNIVYQAPAGLCGTTATSLSCTNGSFTFSTGMVESTAVNSWGVPTYIIGMSGSSNCPSCTGTGGTGTYLINYPQTIGSSGTPINLTEGGKFVYTVDQPADANTNDDDPKMTLYTTVTGDYMRWYSVVFQSDFQDYIDQDMFPYGMVSSSDFRNWMSDNGVGVIRDLGENYKNAFGAATWAQVRPSDYLWYGTDTLPPTIYPGDTPTYSFTGGTNYYSYDWYNTTLTDGETVIVPFGNFTIQGGTGIYYNNQTFGSSSDYNHYTNVPITDLTNPSASGGTISLFYNYSLQAKAQVGSGSTDNPGTGYNYGDTISVNLGGTTYYSTVQGNAYSLMFSLDNGTTWKPIWTCNPEIYDYCGPIPTFDGVSIGNNQQIQLTYSSQLGAWILGTYNFRDQDDSYDKGLNSPNIIGFAELAYETGSSPWFVGSTLASMNGSDFNYEEAYYLNLNYPNLHPWFEGPNEEWNQSTFPQSNWAVAMYNNNAMQDQTHWDPNYTPPGMGFPFTGNEDASYGEMMSLLGQAVYSAYGGDMSKYEVVSGLQFGSGGGNYSRINSYEFANQSFAAPGGYTTAPAYKYVTSMAGAPYLNPPDYYDYAPYSNIAEVWMGYQNFTGGPGAQQNAMSYFSAASDGYFWVNPTYTNIWGPFFNNCGWSSRPTGCTLRSQSMYEGGIQFNYQYNDATQIIASATPSGSYCQLNMAPNYDPADGTDAFNATLSNGILSSGNVNNTGNLGYFLFPGELLTWSGGSASITGWVPSQYAGYGMTVGPITGTAPSGTVTFQYYGNGGTAATTGVPAMNTVSLSNISGGSWASSYNNLTVESANQTSITVNLNCSGLGTMNVASFTGSISGSTLTVSSVTSGTIAPGQYLYNYPIGQPGTYVITSGSGTSFQVRQLHGYLVGSITSGVLTITAGNSIQAGDVITGTGIPDNTTVVSGSGNTWTLSDSTLTVASENITDFYPNPAGYCCGAPGGDTYSFLSGPLLTYTGSENWINTLKQADYFSNSEGPVDSSVNNTFASVGGVHPSSLVDAAAPGSQWRLTGNDIFGYWYDGNCNSCVLSTGSTQVTLDGSGGVMNVGDTVFGQGIGTVPTSSSNTTITACTPAAGNTGRCGGTAGDVITLSQAPVSNVTGDIQSFTTAPTSVLKAYAAWSHRTTPNPGP